ncbi:hypothetical protein VCO01S_07530 [Vibrio comitans NBRC 102076]|uniref:Uncharacterized protein n=1 Tax=Vibrio comitans NBRC 102076 TaxID=1219078 RepID=A0A4Y3ILF7_9VIBR|nr:hypothetical protein VCO01S_07530 [Vibrio comitans NBRC 102076]
MGCRLSPQFIRSETDINVMNRMFGLTLTLDARLTIAIKIRLKLVA